MATHNAPEPTYSYDTAPDSPQLAGMGVTSRMLRRAVEHGKISYSKFGLRIIFSASDLQEYVARAAVKAVR